MFAKQGSWARMFPDHFIHSRQSLQVLTSAMSEIEKKIASNSAVSSKPDLAPSSVATSISPGKVANLRASYLQQPCDLYGLFDCVAITQSEFDDQKSLS